MRNPCPLTKTERSVKLTYPSDASAWFEVDGLGVAVWGLRFTVYGFVFRVSCFGFRVSDFGFQISGFGWTVSDFGFRVSGFGLRLKGEGSGLTMTDPPSPPGTVSLPKVRFAEK